MRRPCSFGCSCPRGSGSAWRAAFAAIGALLASLAPRAAKAAEDAPVTGEPPVAIAMVAGAVTAVVPVVIGVVHTAGASTASWAPRNVGYAVAGAGPALSPIIAHIVVGEYARAAAFGAAPVAAEIALSTQLAVWPDSVFSGTVGSRLVFGLLVSADLFGAAFGMVDVLMARDRWLARNKRVASDPLRGIRLSPMAGGGRAGLTLGGPL